MDELQVRAAARRRLDIFCTVRMRGARAGARPTAGSAEVERGGRHARVRSVSSCPSSLPAAQQACARAGCR